jgi:hypothetical protein
MLFKDNLIAKKKNEFFMINYLTMNTIILLKVFTLTYKVNYLNIYYKNIYANVLMKKRFPGFPEISYSTYIELFANPFDFDIKTILNMR